jgi:translation initiation factor 6
MAGLKQSLQVDDRRLNIGGSSLLGVFACCTDEVVLVPPEVRSRELSLLENCLGVKPIPILVGGSSVVGSLVAGNTSGFILTSRASRECMQMLTEYGRVARLPDKINAAGNVILVNDRAAMVHPGLSRKACEMISKTLGVTVKRGTIGGIKTVGMTAVATNTGLLVHPRISLEELSLLEDLFDLPVDVGTVNFGSPLIGSGLLVNRHGYVAGRETTGHELGRIEDALGFVG